MSRTKMKTIKPPSKKVVDAWKVIADYAEENGVYCIQHESDMDFEGRKVTKGKKGGLQWTDLVFDIIHTLVLHSKYEQGNPIKIDATVLFHEDR